MQTIYGGVKVHDRPDLANVALCDSLAMPCVMEMSHAGLTVDADYLKQFGAFVGREMDRVTEAIRDVGGHYINPGSDDQVAELLFRKLCIKQRGRVKMTPSGDRETTGKDVLESIRYYHPVVPYLLEFRELHKLKGTYVDGILSRLNKQNKLYPNYSETRVPSGRLACSDPNLMALPDKTDLGRQIRKSIIARPGYKIVSIDQSQIEMRVAAAESVCKRMIEIFNAREDIHKQTASSVFRVPVDQLDDYRHRKPSKTLGFLVLFDGSAPTLRDKITIACDRTWTPAQREAHVNYWTEERCAGLINDWYDLYPEIAERRLVHHGRVRRHGFVWDMIGRIRRGGGINSRDGRVVSATLREMANIPMQGGAQAIMKCTMAECYDVRDAEGLDVTFLLQVHDELILEVEESIVDYTEYRFRKIFNNAIRLDVPLDSGAKHGDRWSEWDED